jgi:hypothetical protein
MDFPAARPEITVEMLTSFSRGLPQCFPLRCAFLTPAMTRSRIKERSSSATDANTVKTILPAGVAVSSASDRLQNAMPTSPLGKSDPPELS